MRSAFYLYIIAAFIALYLCITLAHKNDTFSSFIWFLVCFVNIGNAMMTYSRTTEKEVK